MRVLRCLRTLLRLTSIVVAAGVAYITIFGISGKILDGSNQAFWTKAVIFDLAAVGIGMVLDWIRRRAIAGLSDDALCKAYGETLDRDCLAVKRLKAGFLLAVIINSGMLAILVPRGNAQFSGEWESIAGYLPLLVSAAAFFLMRMGDKTLQITAGRILRN